MKKEYILVVEDEEDIRELISYNLQREGYQIKTAATAEQGLSLAENLLPELFLLDIMLPGMDGLELCKELKQDPNSKNIPIIMISAKGEERDIVKGLEFGADDYISKPFSAKILLARVRAVLRRHVEKEKSDQSIIDIDNLHIDPRRFEVSIENVGLKLTLTEFRLLHLLARNPGRVFTRYQIVDAVKGEDYVVTDRAVDVQIVGLRKKLGSHESLIETVRGVGYRFKDMAKAYAL